MNGDRRSVQWISLTALAGLVLALPACSDKDEALDNLVAFQRQEAKVFQDNLNNCDAAVAAFKTLTETQIDRAISLQQAVAEKMRSGGKSYIEKYLARQKEVEREYGDAMWKFGQRCSAQAKEIAKLREATLQRAKQRMGY